MLGCQKFEALAGASATLAAGPRTFNCTSLFPISYCRVYRKKYFFYTLWAYCTKFGRSRWNGVGLGRGSKLWSVARHNPWDGVCSWHFFNNPFPTWGSMLTNRCWSYGTSITYTRRKKLDLSRAAFKGHRKWHASIGYLIRLVIHSNHGSIQHWTESQTDRNPALVSCCQQADARQKCMLNKESSSQKCLERPISA